MTSHDVRDMLDLAGASAPRPAKKQKTAAPKTTLRGLAREVHSLGGDNPIAIVPEVMQFKKKRFGSRKPAAKWELRAFKNSARGDNLVLRHWRRADVPATSGPDEMEVDRPEPEMEDSAFAKFNVQVNITKYDDEQYKANLESEDWSRDETDYLMALTQDYDLRWPMIWDRYEYKPPLPEGEHTEGAIMQQPKVRSLEGLKARYYSIAAKMMAVNKPIQFMAHAEFNVHELMMNYNPAQEAARKKFAEAAFHRTKEEASEEQSLLVELKRILARTEKLNEERRELYSRLDAPPSSSNVGFYNSSQGLQQLLQQLMAVDKSKKRKSLMGPEGMSPAGPGNLTHQQAYHRRESAHRESISGPSTASTLKKGSIASVGQGPSERRRLTAEEETIYGVSHPERSTSGPSFRTDKINRIVTSKSSAQQAKIANTLHELSIGSRLIMPTEDTGKSFEGLIQAIGMMLDAKKVVDKLTGEINVLKEVKKQREQRERVERGEVDGGSQEVQESREDGDGDVRMENATTSRGSRASSVHKE